jgi:hypothetical protein
MSKFLRITSLATAVAGLALTATPAAAQQVGPNNGKNATATARIVKPLTLEWVDDLDLGNIILTSGTWTGAVVGVAQDGTPTCPTTVVTCTGTMKPARYKVTGTNNQTVKINVDPVLTLINQNDTTVSLPLSVDSPGTINLGNSGASGFTFALGGDIVVDAATLDGTYFGTFAVTVEYN